MEKKRYGAIDGLRTIAAFGIVMMHIQTNSEYKISGFLYDTVIPSFTNFVFLFMTVSAFGMCCGYYEKILNNQIDFSDFYGRRFKKVLPFFGILVFLDFLLSPSAGTAYEMFADLTLMFGFLPEPRDITVIGVGWFLGLIFVFYICFPFFLVLLKNKKSAWISFAISLIYNYACVNYFEVGRSNILYSACFFLEGGLIYLYRDEISKLNRVLTISSVIISIVLYYVIGGSTMTYLLVSGTLSINAVASRRENPNRFTKFFSGISMEIYLSHMLIFRVIEKLKLDTMIGCGWFQYIITTVTVLGGVTIFAVMMQKLIAWSRTAIKVLFAYKS